MPLCPAECFARLLVLLFQLAGCVNFPPVLLAPSNANIHRLLSEGMGGGGRSES
jgi:hypothetical protein